jgi:hypothetical protein
VFSLPDDPAAEVLERLRVLQERYDISPAEIDYFNDGPA